MARLDSDLLAFENRLRANGEFESLELEPGVEVAIRPSMDENEWILGTVIYYDQEIGYYDVADVDDSKRYHLPSRQVIRLDNNENKKFSKGEEIQAVYPDTSVFYPAIVVQGPKKISSSSDIIITVQFHGDNDDCGNFPSRTIPLKYAIKTAND